MSTAVLNGRAPESATVPASTSVAIIGAGFSGISMAIKLKRAGIPFTVLEKAHEVGGVWRDNSYPGAACDVPSHLYSYSFEPRHDWSRKYGRQGEIKSYLEHCARKYGVYEHIRFGCEVDQTRFDEATERWQISTAGGEEIEARFLVAGTGQLSLPADPKIPGIESFQGKVFHSARWDHEYDLTGKRVAVAGTGASAIQFVPQIAERVAQLHILQRSAPYVLPKPDRSYSRLEKYLYRHVPFLLVLSRLRQYLYHEMRVLPLTKGIGIGFFEGMWRLYLRRQVKDERLRQIVTPDYRPGCKRILISNDWYPTLLCPNVEVIPSALSEVRGNRVVAADGSERDVDAIIFGTGFATSDFLAPMTITGRDGCDLHELWGGGGGAEAYNGIAVSGFPNMFILYGPNTNLGHNSIVYMIESQTDYVLEAIRHTRALGAGSIDVRPDIQHKYNAELQERLKGTVWNGGCESWYLTEAGRNSNNWPSFTFEYRRRTRYFEASDYAHAGVPELELVA